MLKKTNYRIQRILTKVLKKPAYGLFYGQFNKDFVYIYRDFKNTSKKEYEDIYKDAKKISKAILISSKIQNEVDFKIPEEFINEIAYETHI